MKTRGFTLLEVVVGSAVGLVMTLAAFAFARHQSHMIGRGTATLSMEQGARASLDLLVEDVRHAGVGVGHRPDGTFGGLLLGTFAVGGVTFSADVPIALEAGTFGTDDLGLRLADGAYSTIADWSSSGTAQVCGGSGVQIGDLAVVRSEDSLASRTVRIDALTTAAPCTLGVCTGGCDTLTWSADPSWLTEASAATVSYLGGELSASYRTVVWFVEATSPSRPRMGALRRATFDASHGCTARDATCGDLVAEGIETLQTQTWEWDPSNDRWNNISAGLPARASRIRVDLELVTRARAESERPTREHVDLRLQAGMCLPSCTTTDRFERRVFRASVEVKNAGRARLR